MSTKRQSQEQEEARNELRKILTPGDTVHTILRHVSRSGMQRVIDLYTMTTDADGRPWLRWIGHLASTATGIGWTDKYGGGLKMDGCGSDMGWEATYSLSRALWPSGYGCVGERCGSNDHSNGDRDYTPHGRHIVGDCSNCLDRPGKDGLGRPCKGAKGLPCDEGYLISDAQHWHKDGGYALKHEWV